MRRATETIKDWTVPSVALPFSMRRAVAVLFAAIVPLSRATPIQDAPWRSVAAEDIKGPFAFRNRRLSESSALVVSRGQPGVLWTLNDGGGGPYLYATDTLAQDLGMFRVPGATNEDWEALGAGPCGLTQCLYIGDTGDNLERRRDVTVYRVPEPPVRLPSGPGQTTGRATALVISYPDGPHDVEALIVTPTGNLLFITKGRQGGVRVYRVLGTAWGTPGTTIAESLGRLPIDPDRRRGRRVTDAALALDGHRVVVRTYSGLFFFERQDDDRLVPAFPALVCETGDLQLQGEGVDWLDRERLVLSSEAGIGTGPGNLAVVRCPVR